MDILRKHFKVDSAVESAVEYFPYLSGYMADTIRPIRDSFGPEVFPCVTTLDPSVPTVRVFISVDTKADKVLQGITRFCKLDGKVDYEHVLIGVSYGFRAVLL